MVIVFLQVQTPGKLVVYMFASNLLSNLRQLNTKSQQYCLIRLLFIDHDLQDYTKCLKQLKKKNLKKKDYQ